MHGIAHELEFKLALQLMELADAEQSIDCTKKCLYDNPLFEPYYIFNRLDNTNKGYLSSEDLVNFLK